MGTAIAKAAKLTEIARDINEHHELACMHFGQAFDHAVKAGLLLIEAKRQVQHGQWLNWLKANVKVGERQAQNYMKVAACPDEKRNAVADLSLRKAINELAVRAPKPSREEAEAEALESVGPFANCAYDPNEDEEADDYDDDESAARGCRRRGSLFLATEAVRAADHQHFHGLLEHPEEIDDEIIEAVRLASMAWTALELNLEQARTEASGCPHTAEDEVADTIPSPSKALLGKLEAELKKKRGRPPGSKNKCKTCGGTGRVIGKTGVEFDCRDCGGRQ